MSSFIKSVIEVLPFDILYEIVYPKSKDSVEKTKIDPSLLPYIDTLDISPLQSPTCPSGSLPSRYTIREYGSPGSRKAEISDEDGRIAKIFRARHFFEARDEAELWIRKQLQKLNSLASTAKAD